MDTNLSKAVSNYKIRNNAENMKAELVAGFYSEDAMKDIIIVVKDQLEYIQPCLESIYANTNNFNLLIWDNNSDPETAEYLTNMAKDNSNIYLHVSETNDGFIIPNNRLAEKTTAPYIILLNSDTTVEKDWDKVMLGYLQTNPKVAVVGYGGCCLDENYKGGIVSYNSDIDYVSGWGICIRREIYNVFGLFDEVNLKFGYCEDADFCLRLKEAGHEIYAINLELVHHYENKTFKKVVEDENFKVFFKKCFDANHAYMREYWKGRNVVRHELPNLSRPV